MKINTILQLLAFLGIIAGFVYYWYTKRGRRIQLIVNLWVNGQQIYYKTIYGYAKRRFPENTDESLLIPLKPKIWTTFPESEYFKINTKGEKVLHCAIDEDEVYWIKHDNTKYQEITESYYEDDVDKNGNIVQEDVYVKDSNGELVLDPVYDSTGIQLVNELGEPVFRPRVLRQNKKIKKEKTRKIKAITESAMQPNKKSYFLNKTHEIYYKFKKDPKNEKLKIIAGYAFVFLLVISTVYLSYKHIKTTMMDEAEAREAFFLRLAKEYTTSPPLSDKPDNYGKKVVNTNEGSSDG